MTPMLSVIIPTYHRNDLLAACLDCLRPGVQTLDQGAYEAVVSDDGHHSTAWQLLTDQYPWVRWVAGPRKGPAANRNNGAAAAQGPWLVFTDDDCLPAPNWLMAYADAIRTNPTITVFEGKTVADRPRRRYDEEAPINETGGNFWSCNVCIGRETFGQVQGFDEGFPYAAMEDIDLALRIRQRCATSLFLPEALIVHPIRRVSPVKYDQVFSSYVYYVHKHEPITLRFRLGRLKELLYSFLTRGCFLASVGFKGWRSFVHEHLFIAKTIYLPAKTATDGGTAPLSDTTLPIR